MGSTNLLYEKVSKTGGESSQTTGYRGDVSHMSFQLTIRKLNEKNYLEWAQSVKLVIDERGKLGYLTGAIKPPVDRLQDQPLAVKRFSCPGMVDQLHGVVSRQTIPLPSSCQRCLGCY